MVSLERLVQSFASVHQPRRVRRSPGAIARLIASHPPATLLQTIATTGRDGMGNDNGRRLGWVGAGRMGQALAARLLAAGHDVAVYNRTRSKAEALVEAGATVVDSPADLADRDVVFTIVAGPDDFQQVVRELLSGDTVPSVIVDMTTVSPESSARMRAEAEERGSALLAAPVSGNPKVVKAGRVTFVVSGPRAAYDDVEPLLSLLGAGVTYVGDGELARLAKICHNVMLGVVAQSLAEIVVL